MRPSPTAIATSRAVPLYSEPWNRASAVARRFASGDQSGAAKKIGAKRSGSFTDASTRASLPSAFAIMTALSPGEGCRARSQAILFPSGEKHGALSAPVTSRRGAPPSVDME